MSMRQLRIGRSITLRESPSLERYLQEISKVEMVTAEQEAELAMLIRKGDQHALERLTKANLRFVVSVAKQYQHQGMSLSDLINEGNMGLIRAAGRFDETKGFRFISYAVWWIRQSIIQALAEQSRIVKVPMNKVGIRNKVAQATQQLEQEFERDPTAEELSAFLNIELDDVSATMSLSNRHVSIDSPLDEDGDGSMIDIMENKNAEPADNESNKESMYLGTSLLEAVLAGDDNEVAHWLHAGVSFFNSYFYLFNTHAFTITPFLKFMPEISWCSRGHGY